MAEVLLSGKFSTAFKVVKRKAEALWSPRAPIAGRVQYGKKWTKRREGCGPLVVFGTLTEAVQWAKPENDEEVWQVEVVPMKKSKQLVWVPGLAPRELSPQDVAVSRVRLLWRVR